MRGTSVHIGTCPLSLLFKSRGWKSFRPSPPRLPVDVSRALPRRGKRRTNVKISSFGVVGQTYRQMVAPDSVVRGDATLTATKFSSFVLSHRLARRSPVASANQTTKVRTTHIQTYRCLDIRTEREGTRRDMRIAAGVVAVLAVFHQPA